jgi:hypothetical protein
MPETTRCAGLAELSLEIKVAAPIAADKVQ